MRNEDTTRALLFGETEMTRCDFASLSRATGIPVSTLRRYKDHPELIPFGRVRVIAKAQALNEEEALTLLRQV